MPGPVTRQLVARLEELGRISDEPGRLTRTFLSPAMARANARVGEWMRAAGLVVREDEMGNVIGRLEGPTGKSRTLVLGSHLDTVRDAGRYDGALGVLLPIAALSELQRRGRRLPVAVEVVGFAEEEGVRFASAYLGSKGYTGRLRTEDLALRDADGTSVRQVLERRRGGRWRRPKTAHRPDAWAGYVEVHIEQGPVLEANELAVGVVSAIVGQTRGRLTLRGQAGHAGTTPMHLRRDALAGAAEFITRVEQLAQATPGLVATVGAVAAHPGAPNVIAGEAMVSVDVRHPRDATRQRAVQRLIQHARAIARRRRLEVRWERTQDNGAVACSPRLTRELEVSVRAVQRRSATLVSGAGHDAVAMAAVAPVAMLFVRCRGGLSHHPDEFASAADIEVALRVMVDFLERMAEQPVAR